MESCRNRCNSVVKGLFITEGQKHMERGLYITTAKCYAVENFAA